MIDLEFYKQYRAKIKAFQYVGFLSSWDMQTEAPKDSAAPQAQVQGVLAEFDYNLSTDEKWQNAVDELYAHRKELDEVTRHEIVEMKKSNDNIKKIPAEEYIEIQKVMAEGYPVYVEAKLSGDFELFKPYLQKLIDYSKKQTKWLETEELKGYDVLLDMYEHNYKQADYDKFFDCLKEKLVPFVKKVAELKHSEDFSFGKDFYPAEKQKEFCEYIRDVMCFDKNKGLMKQSEHPFTTSWCNKDVRITNHYYENNFTSSILSCIHETGHALYEAQVDDSLQDTFLQGGASLGIHESQSRFFENIIGRSYAFWKKHFKVLKKTFPKQLKNVDLDTFYKYINQVQCSFIRTEADELTYPLHIMLRYQMEKEIIEGNLPVDDIPSRWNELVKEYLGLDVPNNTLGCLQDVHWAYGNFGYFPTYALGGAIASQIYHKMNKSFNVEKSLSSGTTKKINEWLKDHLHKYGASKYPKELIKIATKEEFNADYYVEYLIDKYSKIYGI